MSPGREAKARPLTPVEVGASGAAADFDGNFTSEITSWLFPADDWAPENLDAMYAELMQWTLWGHLAWAVFPKEGYRL